jgi:hypothetical protein
MTDDGEARRARLRSTAQAEFGGRRPRRIEDDEVAQRRETHAATMAKVARLKELRLAHEAAVERERAEAATAGTKPSRKRRPAGGG